MSCEGTPEGMLDIKLFFYLLFLAKVEQHNRLANLNKYDRFLLLERFLLNFPVGFLKTVLKILLP